MTLAAAFILAAIWVSAEGQRQFRCFLELMAEGEARAAIRAFFAAAILAVAQSLLTATAGGTINGNKP